MIRRVLVIVAALTLLPVLLAASASASAPATTVSMTYMNAAKTAPMAGAHVVVFFMQPGNGRLHNKTTLPQIGSGTADSNGNVTIALDTSAVPKSALADVGTGPDAFNATIWAWNSAGQYNVTQAVIQEGHPFSYRASAGIDTITGQPAVWSASAVAVLDGDFARGLVPASQVQVDSVYRYSPITPLNDAPGLHATLKYTYTSSTSMQSEFELPTTQYISVGLTDNQVEQTGRSTSTGVHQDKNYHRFIWADYYLIEYLIGVPHAGSYLEWEPDHFQGRVSDYNPNIAKKGGKPIGHLAFKQPRFNPGPGGNWAVPIGKNSEPFTRSDGKRQENSIGYAFTLGPLPQGVMGGGIKLQDLMTYGSITWVSWKYEKGCPSGHTRYVFAYHTDPVAAGRILTVCV